MSNTLPPGFDGEVKGTSPKLLDNSPERDSSAERQLRRKIDSRLLPVIVFLAIMSSIDRIVISFARLEGLQSDLHLTDIQYDTVLATAYALYCPALVPSNMFLHRTTRPSLYIGCCAILWGITSGLTGLTKDYHSILACRVLLGVPEAAFYPGCSYLLSRWYTHKVLHVFRAPISTSFSCFSGAWVTLLAAAVLATLQDKFHLAAWRWLFFMEGTATVVVGILSMWLLPDYPHNTRWLNAEERRLAQLRLAKDVGEADIDSEEASIFEGLRMAMKDTKAYLFMFLAFILSLAASFINFFPTLTATLGYSTTITLLMSALVLFFVYRTGERFFHLVTYWWIAVIGFIISLSTMATAARYFSQYLMTLRFSSMCDMLFIAWVANAIPRPPGKRSVVIALTIGAGNAGILVGSYIWKESWSPQYRPSFLICLISLLAGIAITFVIRIMQIRENKRMEHLEVDELEKDARERIEKAAELEGMTFDDAFERRKRLPTIY
ncbi:major facilitator superfamily domain-containing protein [Pisolithus orientalis]|uniref:major facilitator superfamily domain-containing protein n=1 Tax=Pisolithus orientalis TaxID=936130 RepID=UPI0022259903|nr:major facilitator superfamily domain-containing protein [Pisolithus orientalis]KAI5994884.1 major facilitator superfamily domain-containing protein [Pisolithus orientalis]